MEELYQFQLRMNINFPIEISPEAKELILAMLKLKPEERISIP